MDVLWEPSLPLSSSPGNQDARRTGTARARRAHPWARGSTQTARPGPWCRRRRGAAGRRGERPSRSSSWCLRVRWAGGGGDTAGGAGVKPGRQSGGAGGTPGSRRRARRAGAGHAASRAEGCGAGWQGKCAPEGPQLNPIVCFTMFSSLRRLPAGCGWMGECVGVGEQAGSPASPPQAPSASRPSHRRRSACMSRPPLAAAEGPPL